MTPQEFENVLEIQIERCRSVLSAKGADYTDGKDRLFNFKQLAELLGIDPKVVWATYWLKHVLAIANFCSCGKVESEPIAGRIDDAINYLFLLKGLIEEAQ